MNPRSHPQGFTRKELLVAIGLILTGISCFALAQEPAKASADVTAAAKKGREIQIMLSAWAQDHDHTFPVEQTFPVARQFSNEAFRELFKARLVDDERFFAIPGDAWHKNSPTGDGKGPDNDIGRMPDLKEALMPGECAFAYVSGLSTASRSVAPLIANAFSESIGVYSDNKSHKGGVFEGKKAIYVTVGGSAKVVDLSSDFRIKEERGGKKVDVFSKDWGTNPDDIKNPEG